MKKAAFPFLLSSHQSCQEVVRLPLRTVPLTFIKDYFLMSPHEPTVFKTFCLNSSCQGSCLNLPLCLAAVDQMNSRITLCKLLHAWYLVGALNTC